MPYNQRRNFIKLFGLSAALGMTSACTPFWKKKPPHRVVVVGGGVGGITLARTLRQLDATVKITVVEPKKQYTTCFMGNDVVVGRRTLEQNTFRYDQVRRDDIEILHDTVTEIDPISQQLKTHYGLTLDYDRAVVAPGVQFHHNQIEGYDSSLEHQFPHAWSAGPQMLQLKKQLYAMRNGGTVVIAVPPKPFRCPPGPYERASLIAEYCRQYKPRSKVLILDSNESFTKQALFQEGWEALYGYNTPSSMIEWRPQSADGQVVRVSPYKNLVHTDFDDIQAEVVNLIPPQTAGKIAHLADLTDETGWCPIDPTSFESTRHPNIHVIGDACIANPMPKSATAANSQAKLCAYAIHALMSGESLSEPKYANTCYSLVAKDYGISITDMYQYNMADESIQKIPGAGGVSPLKADFTHRKLEASYAYGWYQAITKELFS